MRIVTIPPSPAVYCCHFIYFPVFACVCTQRANNCSNLVKRRRIDNKEKKKTLPKNLSLE